MSSHFRLSKRQMATFLKIACSEPAFSFFSMNVGPGLKFDDMVYMMKSEYDSPSRRLSVQTRYDNLNLRSYMDKYGITCDFIGLTKMVSLLEKYSLQCQPEFRNDLYKLRILSPAVKQFSWYEDPCSRLTTAEYKSRKEVGCMLK